MKSLLTALALAAMIALGIQAPSAQAAGLKLAAPAAATETGALVQKTGKRFKKFGGFKRKFFFKKKFGHHKFYGHRYYKPIYHGRRCFWLKRKWYRTGRFYWKKRYYICRGWW